MEEKWDRVKAVTIAQNRFRSGTDRNKNISYTIYIKYTEWNTYAGKIPYLIKVNSQKHSNTMFIVKKNIAILDASIKMLATYYNIFFVYV